MLALFLGLASLQASEFRTYQVVQSPDSPPGRFSIGFTFGTHKGTASKIEGQIKARWGNQSLDLEPGSLAVLIGDLKTGNKKMECHLQESLGLDYEKSAFPEDHVCDGDELPQSGPNAIVYPKVTFSWERQKGLPIKDMSVTVPLMVEMHGVKKGPYPVSLSLIQAVSAKPLIQVDGQLDLKIADFGIVVKKTLGIGVKDTVRIFLLPVFE